MYTYIVICTKNGVKKGGEMYFLGFNSYEFLRKYIYVKQAGEPICFWMDKLQ